MASIFATFEKNIQKLLGELPPRARSVVERRYGLGGKELMTLEAIGAKEGITRERVRQIEFDAMKKLKKSGTFASFAEYETALRSMIDGRGGVLSEEDLLASQELASVKDAHTVLFFLDLADSIQRRKGDVQFRVRWHTKDAPVARIEAVLAEFSNSLARSEKTLSKEELHRELGTHFTKSGLEADPASLASYVNVSSVIEKNAWEEYGHIDSPFVRPKGMRESAYVALARAGEPLHFRDIAKRIGEFSERPVHVQTVHNELIKDNRFVLVGRGLYALRDWGYEPGFIKDVLQRILKEGGPMTRDAILAEVSKRRQVKASTVLINLQNKKLFKSHDDGTYTLIS